MRPLYVRGMGLFRPGFANVSAWCDGKRDEAAQTPAAALLAGPLKRRTSPLTQIAVEAFGQAAGQAGADLSRLGSVWSIVQGEIVTAVALLEMMHAREGKLSPTRFHNSVYNTASGYASIACANQSPSTTLSGGPEIVGAALLEAAGMLAEGCPDVVTVWADETLPAPFDTAAPLEPLGVALCLGDEPEGALARLEGLCREPRENTTAAAPQTDHYAIAAVSLIERIERRQPGRLALERERVAGDRVWSVELAFDR